MKNKTLKKALCALLFIAPNLVQSQNLGYLYDVSLNNGENLRSMIPEKGFDGYTGTTYRNGNPVLAKGIYSGSEVVDILSDVSELLAKNASMDSVFYPEVKALGSAKKRIGRFR